ncbi:L-sorbose 1-dehydrogenase [Portunus trituberculatus]|uniref:L-sorbose 1-dehydrogenase n=1 Tax=Portunus trituberculatus TaxID=210409 RepID=A0A5B7D6J4_PORTR|nr:L-sorbose 1-dehydrogenase [Portunus trituberculatus]
MEVGARREVILSAGSIASPKLLMLSGVGPRYHLQHHQIPVVADLPGVGQNVHDHVEVLGLSWTTEESVSFTSLFDTFGPSSILQYKLSRKGPLGTAPLNFLNAWVKVMPEGDRMWPDIQVFFNSATFAYDKGTLNPALWGLDMRKFYEYAAEIYGREGFTIRPILLRPKSRGTITLRSRNPDDYPDIDPQLLSDPGDVKTLVEGYKLRQAVFQKIIMQRQNERGERRIYYNQCVVCWSASFTASRIDGQRESRDANILPPQS